MSSANLETGPKIATVEDLLLNLQKSASKNLLGSFRSTLTVLSRYLNVPRERVFIDALVDVNPEFQTYLEQCRYKRNSVRSYCKFVGMLLSAAKRCGWEPKEPEIPAPWQPILGAVAKAGCKDIVRYAIRRKIAPCDFSDSHLEDWGKTLLARGRTNGTVQVLTAAFRRVLRDSGFSSNMPRLAAPGPCQGYGVPLSQFPAQLRDEVEALLHWKQIEFAPKRPRRCRHRAVTAEGLKASFQQLYGFASKVRPILTAWNVAPPHAAKIDSIVELVTQDVLTSFVDWLINSRKVLNETAADHVMLLYSALRYYPALEGNDFSWCADLVKQIPSDPRSGVEDRKLHKYLSYDVVAGIPQKIRDDRTKRLGGSPKKVALSMRDELLILWLTTLPWRQRNIRECQLGANLFKAEIPPMGSIVVPAWAQERMRTAPLEGVWQFYFREHETKNGERVRAVLPRQLISPLEEYLRHYRPLLIHGSDPGTLFLSSEGKPFSDLNDLVGEITLRYAGRRVTPHIFRDIFAYKWLHEHPTDYLTLSKHLWHKDLKTTLNCYGSKFDPSHAACQVEEWLETRQLTAGLSV